MSLPTRRLVVRADANASIGLGHLVRSMAVADIVRGLFAEVVVAMTHPLPAAPALVAANGFGLLALPDPSAATLLPWLLPTDVVLLDGQHFDTAYQRPIQALGCRLVVIDDLHAWPILADLIINHGPEASPQQYATLPHTHFCLGPGFSMVRRQFRERARLPWPTPHIASVLICFGGADPQQFTATTLQAIQTLPQVQQIGIIIGAANPQRTRLGELARQHVAQQVRFFEQVDAAGMAELLTSYDVVVCPASTVLLETLVLGQAAITGYYVPDQLRLAGYVHQHNQAFSVGDFGALDSPTLAPLLQQGILFHQQRVRQPYASRLTPEQLVAEFEWLLCLP